VAEAVAGLAAALIRPSGTFSRKREKGSQPPLSQNLKAPLPLAGEGLG